MSPHRLPHFGLVAAISLAALALSSNVASVANDQATVSGASVEAGFVMDKPDGQARHIELLERLHRGW